MIRKHLEAPTFVETTEELDSMLSVLSGSPIVAVDCEMDSFWSYWGRVCLVQISDGNQEWIVDPGAVNLETLGPLMADPQVTKIFHDAEYDVRQMRRDFGCEFAGIFDTRAAAALCGVTAPGLGSLLKEHFDIHVDKKFQRADWSKRPLTDEMLGYAQSDVAYLHALMEVYQGKVVALGREQILATEHERLTHVAASQDPYPIENYSRIKGATKLDGASRRRLRELFKARNEVAEEHDRAPFRLVSNDALLQLCLNPVETDNDFRRVRGINRHAMSRLVGPLLEALRVAKSLEPIARNPSNQKVKLRGEARDRFDRVRKLRTRVSKSMNVDGSLLLRRELAVALAENPPTDLEILAGSLEDWQLGLFGLDLLQVLHEEEG
jgi:ribonuclease D